ncbi:MAG: PepSY domain-containing protein [Gammaproteobacteria bacterium]|nr:PepSY domain-containing protein [Gammaproteobacteria bacterium]MDH5592347.1 PepSY domain-containing protein [Gammaproteobacteria bacterium]
MNKMFIVSAVLMSSTTLVMAADNPHKFEKCMASVLEERAGQIVKVEMKNEQGGHFYEFDIRGVDGSEWDIECNAHRGLVSEVEREVTDANHPLFKAKAQVSEKDAAKIALAIYPGKVVDVEYEIEPTGAATYEFDIDTTLNQQMKVEVDASSGEIIEANREIWQIGLE